MILGERHEILQRSVESLSGLSCRRAYVSTLYAAARNRYRQGQQDADWKQMGIYENQLIQVEEFMAPRMAELRAMQTRYQVEYEAACEGNTTQRYCEQLYCVNFCNIDTYKDGWNLESIGTQDLLYEITEFLLIHRFDRFLILQVKRM